MVGYTRRKISAPLEQVVPKLNFLSAKRRVRITSPNPHSDRSNSKNRSPDILIRHRPVLHIPTKSSGRAFRVPLGQPPPFNFQKRRRNLSEGRKPEENSEKPLQKLLGVSASTSLANYIKQCFKTRELPPSTDATFYIINLTLGKGAFGKVYLATHVLTGLQVAIKAIDKSKIEPESCKRKVLQEVGAMRRITHPNVLRVLELFETPRYFMMVLEYVNGGDLLALVRSSFRVLERDAKPIIYQIVQGLRACHSKNVVHRDVKLDNMLLTKDLKVKICDFGVSKVVRPREVVTERCGTPAYLAPEIIANRGYEGTYVDVWSLGVLLYAVVCGTVPFRAQSLGELQKLILKCKFEFPQFLSDEARDLIRKMLNPVPSQRISLDEVLQHPWLGSYGQMPRIEVNGERAGFILGKVEELGYPKEYIVRSLKFRDLNHGTASFHVLKLYFERLHHV